jgi:hypothetical protein
LLGDIAQAVASNPSALPIGIEEADYSLGLLERLDSFKRIRSKQR